MTRLDEETVKKVSQKLKKIDSQIRDFSGSSFNEICRGSDYFDNQVDPSKKKTAAVPVTEELGEISGFSETVSEILNYLGFNSAHVDESDVLGFSKAIKKKPDLVFMADNDQFISYNTKTNSFVGNDTATARGYSILTKETIKKNNLSNILLIGLGNVGLSILKFLTQTETSILQETEEIFVHDKKEKKIKKAKTIEKNIKPLKKSKPSEIDLIIDVTPVKNPINLKEKKNHNLFTIQPGVPPGFSPNSNPSNNSNSNSNSSSSFGGEVELKSFHDPLAIGVGSMAFMALNNWRKR
ncbi:MAG: (3R)-3-methyl-D-ornithyl-N6-L-lysine dehydrogenase pyrrolysine biosynthesis enzyme PylD [Candidatus Methanohalarchaeum thermophilum]|uniref:(3R)-3-methyl-D-ornithyl-N6-L-lysine dehydrogenase pyrrolysine biosynthesis enzyme PylD n=1 Tax=Methanohalarchaeum thermophilum TaxID=1903181 RepID=A0A1Q6DT49_METT1|nr:MAG: (3R)-3-methyl-D-ornithyl-N6-L-lysine dehydrogenase pyrrolysine biosynthesis enzyme PylD [Candidatus Methanohalarchaeum thermophilum]